jgi:hypothetical protein
MCIGYVVNIAADGVVGEGGRVVMVAQGEVGKGRWRNDESKKARKA